MTTPIEIVINGRDNTGSAFGSASSGLAKISQIAAGILTSQVFTKLASAAVDFGKSVFTEAMDAQLVMADLDAVLKSTGGTAGVTREAAISLADGLSTMTRFSDDAILKGENMLLTFTNIGKDIFPMATEAMLNLATKMGTDAGGAAIQLGKALQDPVGGITALRRVGVAFTDNQEKQIKTMVEAGDVMGAQKMILAELEKEFGGAAKAAGGTFAGQMDILKNKVNNLKEGLGLKLMPTLQGVADKLIKLADNPAVIKFFEDMANGIIKMLEFVVKIPDMFAGAGQGIQDFVRPFLPAIRSIMTTFEAMRPSLEKTAELLGGKLADAGKVLSEKIMPFLVEQFDKFAAWLSENRPLIEKFTAMVGEKFGQMAEKMILVWAIIEPILSGLFDLILGIGKIIMQVATGDWAGAWDTMKIVVQDAWTAITESIIAAAEWLVSYFGGGTFEQMKAQWAANWNAFKQILSQIWTIIKSTVSNGLESIKGYFSSAWRNIIGGVASFGGSIVTAISSSITAAVNGASSAIYGFVSLGSKIISYIIQGLNNAKNSLLDYLRGIISGLVSGLFGGGFSGGTSGSGDFQGTNPSQPFASGTPSWMTVPPGYNNDNYPIRLTSGERFAVVPAGKSLPSGEGRTTNNYYNAHIVINQRKQSEPRQLLRGLA